MHIAMDWTIVFLGIIVSAYAKTEQVDLRVHQRGHNGKYEVEIGGKMYNPSTDCSQSHKPPTYFFLCHVHCILMGSKNGLCIESNCQCEGKGNQGDAMYQKNYGNKTQKGKQQKGSDVKKYVEQDNKKDNAKQTKDKKKQKNKEGKASKKEPSPVTGTNIIEVIASNEARMKDPTYSSAESKEKK